MDRRFHILLSAYACEPGKGSEPEVGWQWALQMARFHDVTVVTRANNRAAIENALKTVPDPHPDFLYYDPAPWVVRLKKRGLPVAVFYLIWQIGVRRFLAPRLAEFDLIHHLTFNSFRQPGLWVGCDKPIILGPLGGGQICPWKLLPGFGLQLLPELMRSVSVVATQLLPLSHASFKAASIILAANKDTARRLPHSCGQKVRIILETGLLKGQLTPPRQRATMKEFRLIWIGRLERWKFCGLAIEALSEALTSQPNLSLTIVGQGPDRPSLERMALRRGVAEAVEFKGRIGKEEIQSLLQLHDALVFTSTRDTSGNVVLEAMAAGLPVITLAHHGAAEMTTEDTALRIRPDNLKATKERLAQAMIQLARSAELSHHMGMEAQARIKDLYLWDKKGPQMHAIYKEAVTAWASRNSCK